VRVNRQEKTEKKKIIENKINKKNLIFSQNREGEEQRERKESKFSLYFLFLFLQTERESQSNHKPKEKKKKRRKEEGRDVIGGKEEHSKKK